MSKFTTGLVVGVGIGFLFAPLSGQEMRQTISERVQKLRASATPAAKHLQAPSPPAHSTQPTQNTQSITQPTDTVSAERSSLTALPDLQQTTSAIPTEAIPEPSTTSTQPIQPTQQDAAVMPIPHTNEATASSPSTNNQVFADATPVVETPTPTEDDERTIPLPSPTKYSNNQTTTDQNQLASIPGMTPELRQTFENAGITTQQQLLQRTPTKEAASDLAHSIGTSVRSMRHVVTCADLFRLPGADSDTVALLEQAGVTSCQDLQQRNPEHLHAKLVETQAQQDTAARVPDLDQLTAMISAAANLSTTNKA